MPGSIGMSNGVSRTHWPPSPRALTGARLAGWSMRISGDESSWPRPHLDLFEAFAGAVGAGEEAEATEATKNLVRRYEEAAALDPIAGLAVVGAYEIQAAAAAATEGRGAAAAFRTGGRCHRVLGRARRLGAQLYAAWTVEALCELGASPAMVLEFATSSADAWWAFLDEQEIASAALSC